MSSGGILLAMEPYRSVSSGISLCLTSVRALAPMRHNRNCQPGIRLLPPSFLSIMGSSKARECIRVNMNLDPRQHQDGYFFVLTLWQTTRVPGKTGRGAGLCSILVAVLNRVCPQCCRIPASSLLAGSGLSGAAPHAGSHVPGRYPGSCSLMLQIWED